MVFMNLNTSLSFKLIIEFFIFIVSLLIAYRSYRVYKITKTYDLGYFALGFLSLGVAFFLNFFSWGVYSLHAAQIVGTLTFYSYSAAQMLFRFFALLGFTLILFATRNIVDDLRGTLITYFFMILVILGMILVPVFNILSVLMLLMIAYHYYKNIMKCASVYSLFIFIAVLLLLLAQLMFFFICPGSFFIQDISFLSGFMLMYFVIFRLTC